MEIFLSYEHSDQEIADELAKLFGKRGVDVFQAGGLVPPAEWRKEILQRLESCNALVAIVTDNYSGSAYANQEAGIVMGKGKPPISLRFTARLPGFLEMYQAYSMNSYSMERAVDDIVRKVRESPQEYAPFDRELADRVYIPLRKEVKGWLQNPWHLGGTVWRDLDQEAMYLITRVRKRAPDIAEICDRCTALFDQIWRLRGAVSNLVTEKSEELAQAFQGRFFDKSSKVTFSNFRLTPDKGGDLPFYVQYAFIKGQRMREFIDLLVAENYPHASGWRLEILASGTENGVTVSKMVASGEEAIAFGDRILDSLMQQDSSRELLEKSKEAMSLGIQLLSRIEGELQKT